MEHIVCQFIDFQQFIGAVPFGSGHINDTYKVEIQANGKTESFLLQRLNHSVFQRPGQVMANIRLVAQHLSQQDYPLKILSPFSVKNGEWLYRDEQTGYWRMFPFFENTFTFDRAGTEDQAFEAAKAFGAFAKGLDSIAVQKLYVTIPQFHDGLKRLVHFKHVLQKAIPERLKAARNETEEILQNQLIFNKIARLDLPLRAIHHDTKISNLLFDKKNLKPVAVVDLDTVMPGIVLSDFGDMVRTVTSTADEDETELSKVEMQMPFFKAILEGFLVEMSGLLTPTEQRNLPEGGCWLTLMQAIRFLSDYLEGDVYYKIKYPEHNLNRARNQLALFRSMSRQLDIKRF